jgi:hypothetical protein
VVEAKRVVAIRKALDAPKANTYGLENEGPGPKHTVLIPDTNTVFLSLGRSKPEIGAITGRTVWRSKEIGFRRLGKVRKADWAGFKIR